MRNTSRRQRRPVSVTLALVLAAGALVSTPAPPASATTSFVDVSSRPGDPTFSEFAEAISWMSESGISRGWDVGEGRREYRPWIPIARDAMAAFLYRYAGSPEFSLPAASPFVDVPVTSEFYREIAWLAANGISTGWVADDGTREFRPLLPIARDAMAAFIYRFDRGRTRPTATAAAFGDVPADSQFAREISWLAGAGITSGFDAPEGRVEYRPLASITRDAMAAFLHRHSTGGLAVFTAAATPTILGEPRRDATLTAAPSGQWHPLPDRLAWQWLRDGVAVPGATEPAYTVGAADVGRSLTVRTTATAPGFLSASRRSAAVTIPDSLGATLPPGASIGVGDRLRSPNGSFRFDVNGDGNLTVSGPQGIVWQSFTRGNAVSHLHFGTDGMLTLRRPDGSTIWNNLPATGAAARLELRDSGELAVILTDGRTLWSSHVQGARVFGLPFERGARWSAGGPHPEGSGAWNALDFGPIAGQSRRVVTIADGTVGWVRCGTSGYLTVDHGGGWKSSYYHLVNERRDLVGTFVRQGTHLGEVGRTVPCGGGATFDHVHLRIFYQDRPVPMNGFTLGGYTAYSTGTPYDGYWHDAAGNRVLTSRNGAWCCLTAP